MRTMAGYAVALKAGHEAGDYWVQTSHQSITKSKPGLPGEVACAKHVLSYVATQAVCVAGAALATGHKPNWGRVALGLAVSGITHYAADRRTHGLMFRIAKAAGRDGFLRLVPWRGGPVMDDEAWLKEPALGTGAWALDQSWHEVLGVFVPALIMASGDRES